MEEQPDEHGCKIEPESEAAPKVRDVAQSPSMNRSQGAFSVWGGAICSNLIETFPGQNSLSLIVVAGLRAARNAHEIRGLIFAGG
jgi:hypothetical protein